MKSEKRTGLKDMPSREDVLLRVAQDILGSEYAQFLSPGSKQDLERLVEAKGTGRHVNSVRATFMKDDVRECALLIEWPFANMTDYQAAVDADTGDEYLICPPVVSRFTLPMEPDVHTEKLLVWVEFYAKLINFAESLKAKHHYQTAILTKTAAELAEEHSVKQSIVATRVVSGCTKGMRLGAVITVAAPNDLERSKVYHVTNEAGRWFELDVKEDGRTIIKRES